MPQQITNNHNYPAFLVKALTHKDWGVQELQRGDISMTALQDAPQINILRKRHRDEIVEDAIDFLWRRMGDAVHSALQEPFKSDPDFLIEKEFITVINNWKLKMRLDLYQISEQTIIDFKYTSVWSYIFGEKWEWKNQLNNYNYIMYANGYPPAKQLLNVVIFRDWKESDYEKNREDYPPLKIMVIPQEILPLLAVKESLERNMIRHQGHENKPDWELPECTQHEKWEKPTIYAVKKIGASRALTGGLHGDYAMALAHQQREPGTIIETRKGVSTRCLSYCAVKEFCWQRKREHSPQVTNQ